MADQITPGAYVRLEDTRGLCTGTPVTTTHEGFATLDCEGVLRVDGVNVTTDDSGYYPAGVVILSIGQDDA